MADSYTETTSTSWFGKLRDAFFGVVVGLVLFVVAPLLLFWNEGRAVHTAQGLAEGANAVTSVKGDAVDSKNEGHLVHVTAKAEAKEPVKDSELGVSANGLRLKRSVEMYQWKQEKHTQEHKKLGGGTEKTTTYSYSKGWSSSQHDSGQFKVPAGHENPAGMPYKSMTADAPDAKLGAFTMTERQVAQLDTFQKAPMTEQTKDQLPADLTAKVTVTGGLFYLGKDPAAPAVGDVRISYEVVPAMTVSVIAQQRGSTFEPYNTKAGTSLDIVRAGDMSAEAMFKREQEANEVMTWVVRLVGVIVWWIGIAMMFGPISAFGDVIPLIGDILGAGIGFFSFIMSLALSLLTISMAWIAYRPLLGGSMLAGVILLLVFAKSRGKSK